jgi:ATP-dependent RNA helicase SUPV3L1/SUV3
LVKADELEEPSLEKIEKKLKIFISNRIEKLMPSILSLANSKEFRGSASGLVHMLVNRLGILIKTEVIEQYKNIDNQNRAKLRGLGIRFGYKIIYDPTLLKPEANRLRICLFNVYYASPDEMVLDPPPGLVTVEYDKNISKEQYLAAGFFVAGCRAIRVDMLERLYFMFKDYPSEDWITIQPSMLSITGLGLERFSELIKSLRFEIKYEKVEKSSEIITFEKDGDFFKVMFRKRRINKKEKKSETFREEKKAKHFRKKSKPIKNKISKIDSPFSSLQVLLEN